MSFSTVSILLYEITFYDFCGLVLMNYLIYVALLNSLAFIFFIFICLSVNKTYCSYVDKMLYIHNKNGITYDQCLHGV